MLWRNNRVRMMNEETQIIAPRNKTANMSEGIDKRTIALNVPSEIDDLVAEFTLLLMSLLTGYSKR